MVWTDPKSALMDFQHQLRRDQHDYWLVPSIERPHAFWLRDQENRLIEICLNKPTTVGQCLRAETLFNDWGVKTRILDGHTALAPDAWIKPTGLQGSYTIVKELKAQRKEQPTGIVLVTVVTPEHHTNTFMPQAGTFLFEILPRHHLVDNVIFKDEFGHRVFPDQRIWQSITLRAVPQGFGLSHRGLGLNMDFIKQAATFLQNFAQKAYPMLWSELTISCATMESLRNMSPHDLMSSGIQVNFAHAHLVLHEQHWILVLLQKQLPHEPTLIAHVYDGIPKLARLWQSPILHVKVDSVLRQTQPTSCGTILLGHLAYALGLCAPAALPGVESLHEGLLFLSDATPGSPEGLGPDPVDAELQADLKKLLMEKGVPADRVAERAETTLKKLFRKSEQCLRNQMCGAASKHWPVALQ